MALAWRVARSRLNEQGKCKPRESQHNMSAHTCTQYKLTSPHVIVSSRSCLQSHDARKENNPSAECEQVTYVYNTYLCNQQHPQSNKQYHTLNDMYWVHTTCALIWIMFSSIDMLVRLWNCHVMLSPLHINVLLAHLSCPCHHNSILIWPNMKPLLICTSNTRHYSVTVRHNDE